MLLPVVFLYGGKYLPGNADRGKGGKRIALFRIVCVNSLAEAQHSLLQKVILLGARQKIGPGSLVYQTFKTADQVFFRKTVSRGGQRYKLFIRHRRITVQNATPPSHK